MSDICVSDMSVSDVYVNDISVSDICVSEKRGGEWQQSRQEQQQTFP